MAFRAFLPFIRSGPAPLQSTEKGGDRGTVPSPVIIEVIAKLERTRSLLASAAEAGAGPRRQPD
ncbi:hypothetical protein [Paenibacillus dendritiformis]|uniref:hypothetical protein n=1 Tax=Paenibacillus dendritiformis TaxID=130049 RepID=UPI00387E1C01